MRTRTPRARQAAKQTARRGAGLRGLFTLLPVLLLVLGCAPVRPEQRAILADKIMRFGADARARAALDHALENREGSVGGGSVQGGGCGCN